MERRRLLALRTLPTQQGFKSAGMRRRGEREEEAEDGGALFGGGQRRRPNRPLWPQRRDAKTRSRSEGTQDRSSERVDQCGWCRARSQSLEERSTERNTLEYPQNPQGAQGQVAFPACGLPRRTLCTDALERSKRPAEVAAPVLQTNLPIMSRQCRGTQTKEREKHVKGTHREVNT